MHLSLFKCLYLIKFGNNAKKLVRIDILNRLLVKYANWHQARKCPSAWSMPIGVKKKMHSWSVYRKLCGNCLLAYALLQQS